MAIYYVFDKANPESYTMHVVPDTETVDQLRGDPNYTVMLTIGGALQFIETWSDRFDPKAYAAYRAFLTGARDKEPEAEQAEPAANIAASEALEGALCLAAQSIARALSGELSEEIETREDIARMCERIEAYRLALSALSRTLITAERAAQEG